MKNLIKLNYSHLFLLLVVKICARFTSGLFLMFMFIVFNDMYGIIAGIIALIIGLVTSSKAATQVELNFYALIVAIGARKSNLSLKELIENKETFSVQFGNAEPIVYDQSNKNQWE